MARKADTVRESTLTIGVSTDLASAIGLNDGLSPRTCGSKLPDYEVLQQLLQQRQAMFQAGPAQGVCWQLLHWLRPVKFVDADMETMYQRWELASTHTVQKCYQLLVLALCMTVSLHQVGTVRGVLAYAGFATNAVAQIVALHLTWQKQRTALMSSMIVLCDVMTIHIFLALSSICNDLSFASQCATLQKGVLAPAHQISCFLGMVVLAFGLNVQAIWLIACTSIYLILWSSLSLGLHNVPLFGSLLTIGGMFLMLIVIATQARQRHLGNRMQFHMLIELSQRLQDNLQATKDLEAAHGEAMHAQEKAVRATALRTIHDSLMQYTCHQLRNPLHSLRGILEQLHKRCTVGHLVDGMDCEHLANLEESASQLSKVADDVLDFQQLQKGTFVHRPTLVDVHSIIDAAVLQCSGAHIDVDVADDAPITLIADGPRITQMLKIGLSNAIKYSAAQSVVRVLCKPVACDAPTVQEVKFEVWNEGEGLGTLDVPSVFEPYEQAAAVSTGGTRGIGLGLPISMLISRVLGGAVGLEDRSRYTVFWFTVPVAPASRSTATPLRYCGSPSPPSAAKASASGPSGLAHVTPDISSECPWSYWGEPRPALSSPLHTLVVDDLRTNRRLLLAMLRHQGHHVAELEDGDEIANYLHEGAHIDVLLLDIHMVRSDGRDICRFLRQQAHAFPIIAVTGNVSAADIESYVAAGFDGVLGKPFTSQHLASLLKALQ